MEHEASYLNQEQTSLEEVILAQQPVRLFKQSNRSDRSNLVSADVDCNLYTNKRHMDIFISSSVMSNAQQ